MQACQIWPCVWNEQMSFTPFSEVCTHLQTVCSLFSIVVFKGQESAIKICKYVANSVVPQCHDLTLGWELGTLLYNFMVLGLSVPITCGVGRKWETLQAVFEREVSEMLSLKYRAFIRFQGDKEEFYFSSSFFFFLPFSWKVVIKGAGN